MSPVFQLAPNFELCLASGSPRRQMLLAEFGLPYEIVLPQCAEPEPLPAELPEDYAKRMAALKAGSVRQARPSKVIVAADTIVCIDGQILGKPADKTDALKMLARLNGNCHEVYTAVALALADRELETFTVVSKVRFGNFPLHILQAYVESGEPLDKAGAYGAQGQGVFLVESIEGSYSNVVGLPISQLVARLLAHGVIC